LKQAIAIATPFQNKTVSSAFEPFDCLFGEEVDVVAVPEKEELGVMCITSSVPFLLDCFTGVPLKLILIKIF
jgi:hypothetical protein